MAYQFCLNDLEVGSEQWTVDSNSKLHTKEEEIYGLTNQVRRSVVSIPSNIAEGQAKKSTD